MGFRIPRSESGGQWKPLPVGTYDFRIMAVDTGTSNAGNLQIKVSMEVIGPTFAGKKATNWITITEKSGWVVEQLFGVFGIEPTETGEVDDDGKPLIDFEDQDLVGRCVVYDVSIDTYNPDKPQNKFTNPKVSEYDPYYTELKNAAPASSAPRVAAPASAGVHTSAPAAPGGEGAPPRLARRPRPAPGKG